MIVPDTIQPYEGWKALRVLGGVLHSPQQSFRWPPKERAEAECSALTFRWQPRRGKPAEERDPRRIIVSATPNPGWSFSTSAIVMPHMLQTVSCDDEDENMPPNIELPKGMHWSWEPCKHQAASDNDCGCGIYMVDSPELCGFYVDSGTILVELYGWGNVIRGSQGARAQYAYPKELMIPEHLREEGEHAAEQYGVPYTVVPDSNVPSTHDQWRQMNAAFQNLSSSQQKAAAQLQRVNAALAPQSNSEVPPATPFVKLSGIFFVSSIVLGFSYFTAARGDQLVKTAWFISMVMVFLCLLTDLLIFISEDKRNRA